MNLNICASKDDVKESVSVRLEDYGFISGRKGFGSSFMSFVCIIVGWDLGFAGMS